MLTENSIYLDEFLKEYIPKNAIRYFDPQDNEAYYFLKNNNYRAYLSYEFPLKLNYMRIDKFRKIEQRMDSIDINDNYNINKIKQYLEEFNEQD